MTNVADAIHPRTDRYIIPTSEFLHEVGHAKAIHDGLHSGTAQPAQPPVLTYKAWLRSMGSPAANIRTLINPAETDDLLKNELVADRIMFGPSRFAQLRNHPEVASYYAKARTEALLRLLAIPIGTAAYPIGKLKWLLRTHSAPTL